MTTVQDQPKPAWAKLPRPGCENVQFRVLLSSAGITVANLKFGKYGYIDKHSASFDIDVICLSGAGFTSVDDDVKPIVAGQTVRWPSGLAHCLWTESTTMETLMLERHGD